MNFFFEGFRSTLKGRPRRNALSNLVHRQYKSFQPILCGGSDSGEREPPVLGTPPNYRKVRGENFPRKKNICYKLRFQVDLRLSQLIPRLFVLSLFLKMRVNNWNWKWNQKKNRHPCIFRRTCKIHEEKNQLKCQNRT